MPDIILVALTAFSISFVTASLLCALDRWLNRRHHARNNHKRKCKK